MEPNVNLILRDDADKRHEIPVWSQVMLNASPYFRVLLDPAKFEEGRTLQQKDMLEVELPETNAEAMTILCNIWHLKSSKVPVSSELTSYTLYEIAVLVDRYDCVESIQPWPKLWFQDPDLDYSIEGLKVVDIDTIGRWIHISCHFGYQDLFHSLTSTFIQRATSKDILDEEASEYFQNLFPSLQEAIQQRRRTCVDGFRQICTDLMKDLERGQSCQSEDDPIANEKFDCSSIQLGNAILAFRSQLGADWERNENWTRSISDRYAALKGVGKKLKGPKRLISNRNLRIHGNCARSDGFFAQLKSIYETAIAPLPFREFGNMVYRTPPNDAWIDNLVVKPVVESDAASD